MTTAAILDAVALLILVFIVARSARKGFVRSFLGTIFGIANVVLSLFLSTRLADFFGKGILESELSKRAADLIPDLSSLLPKGAFEIFSSALSGAATAAQGEIIAGLSRFAARGLSFLVLFVVLSIVFALITNFVDSVFSLPVLGAANRLAGGIFGLLYASLILFVLLTLVWIFILLSGSFFGITAMEIENTFFVRWLWNLNPIIKLVF